MRVFLVMQDCTTMCQFNEKLLPLRRELFKKIALSGVKNHLLVCNDKNRQYFEEAVTTLCRANRKAKAIEKTLNKYMRMHYKNPKAIQEKTSKYIDKIFESKLD